MNNTDVFELGIMETLKNVFKYSKDMNLLEECSKVIPIPNSFELERIEAVAKGICELQERNLVFLTPEIFLFDELIKEKCKKKVYVCLPFGNTEETNACIRENMPNGLNIEVISEENIYDFSMSDTALFVCGFSNDQGRAFILNKNYLLLQKFRKFLGKKILISAGEDGGMRLPGWKTIYSDEYFNAIA